MTNYNKLKSRIKKSKEKIKKAFDLYPFEHIKDIPISLTTNTYWLDGKEAENKPYNYFYDPEVQLEHQLKGFENHFDNIDDDYIPYLAPSMGTCILQSIYGCEVKKYQDRDLTVTEKCVKSYKDLENISVKSDFENYWMTAGILDMIKYFRKNSDYPVGITDPQGPLDMLAQMTGHTEFCYFLYDYPDLTKKALENLNKTFILWIKKQKELNGEKYNECHGALNSVPPDGVGVWVADDDSVWIDPKFYEKHIVPLHSELFTNFDSGILHYCGNAIQHLNNFKKIKGLRAICLNSMGDLDMVRNLQQKLGDSICIIIIDICPVEEYLEDFLNEIRSKLMPRGLIINLLIPETIGAKDGGYVNVDRDPIETSKKILKILKK